MIKFYRYPLIILSIMFSFFYSSISALEKDRLIDFLSEYDVTNKKCGGKIAYAIENCYPDVAEFLILNNENYFRYVDVYYFSDDLNKKRPNFYYKHPLISAIMNGYTELAILMINLGDINSEEFKSEYYDALTNKQNCVERKNAMRIAIDKNNYEVILSLLLAGFDVNVSNALNEPTYPNRKDDSVYITPLVQAIAEKKLDIAKLLLNHGAEVEKASSSSYFFESSSQTKFVGSPLLKAVDDNFMDGILLLLSWGSKHKPAKFVQTAKIDRYFRQSQPK